MSHQRKVAQYRLKALNVSIISALLTHVCVFAGLFNMSKSGEKDPDFPYVHLWVSADGETHITEAKMSGFELKKYAQDPQYVKEGPSPSKTVFTQLNAGLEQDFHPCPQVWNSKK